MLTYQIRRRIFRLEKDTVKFPAPCVIRFHLTPDQPFGASPTGGRTAVYAKEATLHFDANTGQHSIVSAEPLSPLDVTIEAPDRLVQLRGTLLEIRQEFSSLEQVEDLILAIYFGLPPLLDVRFNDPSLVARVDGEMSDTRFRWELIDWEMHISTTTQEQQEQAFLTAWKRMGLLAGMRRLRLRGALQYFHIAVRLDRSAGTLGEFMAETILNLSKVLEVLFPPVGDGKTREAARVGLTNLGYSQPEIERLFLPAMALRSAIDVGHVSLALLTRQQLTILHSYTERAEIAFREMLDRALTAVENGSWEVEEFMDTEPSPSVLEIVERLRSHFGANET